MFYIYSKNIKDTMKVAKATKEPLRIKASRRDGDNVPNGRDISIEITYHPEKDVKNDIYPHFIVKCVEEELTNTIYFNDAQIVEVRDLYNEFMNQKDESYLEKFRLTF